MLGRVRSVVGGMLEKQAIRKHPALGMQRELGPLGGCHSEWSVIADQLSPEQQASSDLVAIALDAVARTATSSVDFLANRVSDRSVTTWPGEHYRLLPSLCDAIGAERVVEIGTAEGRSSLAVLQSESVRKMVTYDIVSWREYPTGTDLLPSDFEDGRLEQRLVDLLGHFDLAAATLRSADLIFIDGPKDGVFEQEFLRRLLDLRPDHRQLLVLDDTRLMTMVALWREMPAPKLDLTSFGHWSGTGLLLR